MQIANAEWKCGEYRILPGMQKTKGITSKQCLINNFSIFSPSFGGKKDLLSDIYNISHYHKQQEFAKGGLVMNLFLKQATAYTSMCTTNQYFKSSYL